MSNTTPRKWWHAAEENILSLILMAMVILTFLNVVIRYWFGGTIVWGFELTKFLFVWLVILGLGNLVRTYAHLGVDSVINVMNAPLRRITAILIALVCVAYALLIAKGAYDHFANFYNLPASTGRIIPTGFEEMKPYDMRGYVPTYNIPMVDWLRPIWEPIFLIEGDPPYAKMPINIFYAGFLLGVVWLLIRFIVAFIEICRGVSDRLIASHEAEADIEDLHKEGN